MPTNLIVRPRRNENIERALKRFNKKIKKMGILDEYKEIYCQDINHFEAEKVDIPLVKQQPQVSEKTKIKNNYFF